MWEGGGDDLQPPWGRHTPCFLSFFFPSFFFLLFWRLLCSSIIIYYSFFWHTWTLPLPPLLCAIFSFFFLIIMEESSFFFRFFASQVFKTFLGDYLYFFQDRRKDKGAMKIFLFPLSHYEPEAWWMVHYYFFFFFYYFLKKKFWRARRYAHSTFDLRGVGCRPPLLLQKPLYACWQPGSKGCKTFSGLFYSIVSGNINLPYSYSLPPQEGKQTRILQLLFMWKFKKKKNFFISQR